MFNRFYSFIRKYLIAILWAIMTLIGCGVNGNSLPHVSINLFEIDKLAHFTLFGMQAWLILFYSHGRDATQVNWKWVHEGVWLSVFYGVLIEFLQYTVFINRSYDYGDMLADAIGALTCYIFAPLFFRSK
jgi:VanZ family protein